MKKDNKDITGRKDQLSTEPINDADVSNEEKELLQQSVDSSSGIDDENWANSRLDNVDNDNEPLNEQVDYTGSELDVPGSEDDDDDEALGEEDEENNSYSLGGDSKTD